MSAGDKRVTPFSEVACEESAISCRVYIGQKRLRYARGRQNCQQSRYFCALRMIAKCILKLYGRLRYRCRELLLRCRPRARSPRNA